MDWPRWMRAQQSLGHLRLQPRRSRYFRLWTARPLRGSADLGPVRKSASHARAGETQDVLAQMALPPLQELGVGVRSSSSGSGLALCCGLGLLWRLRLGGSGTLYVSGDEETAAVAGQQAGVRMRGLYYSIRRGGDRAHARRAASAPAVIALPRSLYLAAKKYMYTLQLYWPRSRASACSCTSTLVRIVEGAPRRQSMASGHKSG